MNIIFINSIITEINICILPYSVYNTMFRDNQLKLCKRQTRRIYEIARLSYAQKAGGLGNLNEAYKDFRVDVKKRLNVPFQV